MSQPPSDIVHLSLDGEDPRHQTALLGDVMGRQLAGGAVTVHADHRPSADWKVAMLAPGVALARGRQGHITATRDAAYLADGDADFSIFWVHRGAVPFEQNDRRVRLGPSEALLVAHGRPVSSSWGESEFSVLRLPRDALPGSGRYDRAGGLTISLDTMAGRLLTSYAETVWTMLQAAPVPAFVERHLAELAGAAIEESAGRDAGPPGEGLRAARLARMREIVRQHAGNAALGMAEVARQIGLSERAGYQLFEDGQESFSELLYATRLDRARELLADGYAGRILDLALEVGFSDLSHFNRRFRRRFGFTPSDARHPRAS
ncbi:helix-turn-helix domain-containing protein [Sphingomonas sp. AP4-R1]|uniref:helix-turn-helix domain-containing protein n=1 Tax=Sphingomonas sp. AP4-R1 TaxID=2735134 RepID=UPI001493621E|nr:helix-turn-helix domain-containing protein [Sphingomonas sp. AP4-R1]QJU58920.1 helix-turn-helix domain-containing protein [Sphingomonas sp. AP4-R1]